MRHSLTPVVWNRQQMEWLAEAVERCGAAPLGVHLEIDTGMARQGVAAGEELRELLEWLRGQKRIVLDGVMTHFASAEVAGSAQTLEQQERFEEAMWLVEDAGFRPAWVHAGNSSTLDNDGDATQSLGWLRTVAAGCGARAMVRSGLGAVWILSADRRRGGVAHVRNGLLPVMTWKTRVIGVRDVCSRGDGRV